LALIPACRSTGRPLPVRDRAQAGKISDYNITMEQSDLKEEP